MSGLESFRNALIHDVSCFNAETIGKRARDMGFMQPWVVEAFAWDLELYGQLQSLAQGKLILKGGAAAQLFVPLERQRASIDVDVISIMGGRALKNLLRRASEKFPPDLPYLKFKPYTPGAPGTVLPMYTYEALVPSSLGHLWKTEAGEIRGYSLKVDILRLERIPINHARLDSVKTFALDLAYSPNCITPGSLVGDKLLTLATKSVGIPESRAADLPKQVYDLDNLTRFALSEGGIEDSTKAMESLVPMEASFRKIKMNVKDVLTHIKETLHKFSVLDLRQADPRLKKYVSDFQNLYIRRGVHSAPHEWASKGLRINFFLDCLQHKLDNETFNVHQAMKRADTLEHLIHYENLEPRERGKRREEVKQILLAKLERDTGTKQKELRGKPPERVYWQLINPKNLNNIEEKVLHI